MKVLSIVRPSAPSHNVNWPSAEALTNLLKLTGYREEILNSCLSYMIHKMHHALRLSNSRGKKALSFSAFFKTITSNFVWYLLLIELLSELHVQATSFELVNSRHIFPILLKYHHRLLKCITCILLFS